MTRFETGDHVDEDDADFRGTLDGLLKSLFVLGSIFRANA